MKVKIGNQWYEPKPDQPLMVVLSPQDKINIGNMLETATRYAVFDDTDGWSSEEKFAWMDKA